MDKSYQTKLPRTTPRLRDIDFDSIPNELKQRTRWVNWQYRKRRGKLTKVPLNPRTGREASCDTPATWGTFHQALATLSPGKLDGIGFQLGPPYVGIDLDKCRAPETGVIEPWAQEIIDELNSYTEISPSGQGVHVLAKGSLPAGPRRAGQVEMYSGGRYLTVTGHHLAGTPKSIEERSSELNSVHARYLSGRRDNVSARGGNPSPSDTQLIERARRAKNGAKFERLWKGDFSDYESASEADLALCAILTFWTSHDPARIDRLFRQSGLYRNKWDERHGADGRTYGQITIGRAIEQTPQDWCPEGKGEEVSQKTEGAAGCLPTILVNDRQLREVTEDALKALHAANNPPALFVRTGHLVRIRSDETGRAAIQIVTKEHLRARLAEISNTTRTGKKGEVRDCFPPVPMIENILALGDWPFPPVRNIVEAPVLRPDGTVLDKPGYDTATQLVYWPAPGLGTVMVPYAPSRLDIAAALDLIEEMIGEFPFVDKPDKANLLATALTPVLRPAISGPTPLALFDAPQAGTGKGLLGEVIALISTGRAAGMMAAPRSEDEWRKHLTAVLSSGASVITIDNVEHPLESAPLAVALTAREWTGRILGLSKIVTVPVRVTWIASGNNVRLGGDIPRRCYRVRLDAKVARPWRRAGFKHPELLAWVAEHRGELLVALLTLARAWYAADEPRARVPVIGSFDEWARTVGGTLHYAGVTGFLSNLEEMYESSDESTLQWEVFLQALATIFDEGLFTVKQVAEHIAGGGVLADTLPHEMFDEGEKPGGFRRRLGHAFSKRVGTRYGDSGVHLERAGEEKHATKWKVSSG